MNQTLTNPNPVYQHLTTKMRPLISHTADVICRTHLTSLLSKPLEYISSAVWGADKFTVLDEHQIEISRLCASLEHDLFDLLDIKCFTTQQTFAIHYFIRELLLIKICFAIELAKQFSKQLLETAGISWARETMGSA